MSILNGLNNFLKFINDNWTGIVVIVGLISTFVKYISVYKNKTNEEKVNIAKAQIKEVVLKLITDAEGNYADWNKSGSIKRSQVINKIFLEYPILSKVVDQSELISWIDGLIDNSLSTLKDVMNENIQ